MPIESLPMPTQTQIENSSNSTLGLPLLERLALLKLQKSLKTGDVFAGTQVQIDDLPTADFHSLELSSVIPENLVLISPEVASETPQIVLAKQPSSLVPEVVATNNIKVFKKIDAETPEAINAVNSVNKFFRRLSKITIGDMPEVKPTVPGNIFELQNIHQPNPEHAVQR